MCHSICAGLDKTLHPSWHELHKNLHKGLSQKRKTDYNSALGLERIAIFLMTILSHVHQLIPSPKNLQLCQRDEQSVFNIQYTLLPRGTLHLSFTPWECRSLSLSKYHWTSQLHANFIHKHLQGFNFKATVKLKTRRETCKSCARIFCIRQAKPAANTEASRLLCASKSNGLINFRSRAL